MYTLRDLKDMLNSIPENQLDNSADKFSFFHADEDTPIGVVTGIIDPATVDWKDDDVKVQIIVTPCRMLLHAVNKV